MPRRSILSAAERESLLALPDTKDELIGTVAKLAMRQPFVLFKGLTFQKLCLPGAFRPGDHHNKMLRPGLCVVHASPQYL
ncbi:Tn3-family transposase [Enterobacter hormaechei]|nr:Tn3-family transposase [Enterobacter hormaechei]SAB12360.1 Tn3-family transposase [Enterobacter hormaechei]SAE41366.1 Tn3-family transposase [Enterobacter hormaechei]SAI32461.1 Tn3-family transposase [Enterobacter hormaechei]SAI58324.1 Tn3-family transposase [Enterobacter hormaechei]